MTFSNEFKGREPAIVTLFEASFTASENADEGRLIGKLVTGLLQGTPDADIAVFTASADGELVAGAIFTRLDYPDDPRQAFILSPMAVATGHQGRGLGQALLNHALGELRASGVDIAITYGDPAFYSKVGFAPVTVEFAAAPFPLSQPEGWIGQSLTDAPLAPLRGPCTCAEALDDAAYW